MTSTNGGSAPPPPPPMEPWLATDELSDDLQSISFTSTATTLQRSTSSASSSFSSNATVSVVASNVLSLSDLRFTMRLGAGDIGSVYLAELKTASFPSQQQHEQKRLAVKVMDKKELVSRCKEGRAKTEKEILECLDHPFLPTLYAVVESSRWLCLLTEFCPGGDLHVLRQRQPLKRFHPSAVRFYVSEVVVALEYLHMMGIVYRDLKPENVLVRSDGHIMLTDFDLSLRCDEAASTPQIITSQDAPLAALRGDGFVDHPQFTSSSCIIPSCIVPAVSCFRLKRRRKKNADSGGKPEFVAEPVDVRSMSFVGTHEYLAPEIVSGEGHGSPVDWWTLGIFMFELFYGATPFRGADHEATLANIVARALEFPKEPVVPAVAKDLISQLLMKEPARRLGSGMGASSIKHHPYFNGVNWPLLRCTAPPYVPPPFSRDASEESCPETPVEFY